MFCPVGLGTTPGFSRGFHRVCPWDKSGENLGQTQFFSLFYTVEARQTRVCPWDKLGLSLGQSQGRRAAQKVYVKKVYVPFSLANYTYGLEIALTLSNFCWGGGNNWVSVTRTLTLFKFLNSECNVGATEGEFLSDEKNIQKSPLKQANNHC